jgi:hypothetical protein
LDGVYFQRLPIHDLEDLIECAGGGMFQDVLRLIHQKFLVLLGEIGLKQEIEFMDLAEG